MNTKLFTNEELNKVDINKLIYYVDEYVELSNEFNQQINQIELIEEEEGYLEIELQDELNILITQIDYLNKNIRMIKNNIQQRKLISII